MQSLRCGSFRKESVCLLSLFYNALFISNPYLRSHHPLVVLWSGVDGGGVRRFPDHILWRSCAACFTLKSVIAQRWSLPRSSCIVPLVHGPSQSLTHRPFPSGICFSWSSHPGGVLQILWSAGRPGCGRVVMRGYTVRQ